MKKIVLTLLSIVFISGFIRFLFTSNQSMIDYLYFYIGLGTMVIYILNKFIAKTVLKYIQIGLMIINVLFIAGIYIFGQITSNQSFGLGLLIVMLLMLLFAQAVVFIVHIAINIISNHPQKERIENYIIVLYTLIFFAATQVSIPSNYNIPTITWIGIYSVLGLLFIVSMILTIKVFKKDLYILLIIALLGLLIIQNSGKDINIFLQLPFQIMVIILMIIKFTHLIQVANTKEM
ncbi:hypothetical protein KHQ89_01930 [Mycoplasmatota bacterium]|nr:hypothetical protein KHQ89_01930 [Mycoplasmatota bacterium]